MPVLLAWLTVPWRQVGWDEGYARRVRLITGLVGLVLLFSGVVCQWWAGNNIADLPLATLCEA